jgi:hypothetical protein
MQQCHSLNSIFRNYSSKQGIDFHSVMSFVHGRNSDIIERSDRISGIIKGILKDITWKDYQYSVGYTMFLSSYAHIKFIGSSVANYP